MWRGWNVLSIAPVALVGIRNAERHFRDTFLSSAENQSHLQDYYGFNPKLGAIYEINHDTQAFVNFSRSFQTPSFESLVEFSEGPNPIAAYTPLQVQHAWTVEIRPARRIFLTSVGVIALSFVVPK